MKHAIALVFVLAACGPVSQARRAQIESAEDKFCSLRAQEKQAEEALDAGVPR